MNKIIKYESVGDEIVLYTVKWSRDILFTMIGRRPTALAVFSV